MLPLDRRQFSALSLGGLAAILAAPTILLDPGKPRPPVKVPPFQPDTLFLTWRDDPTTTMTVQWVGGVADAEDMAVHYTPMTPVEDDGPEAGWPLWSEVQPTTKPFPLTAMTNFRAELRGLDPGTEYLLKIGTASPIYRFRTMPSKATDAITFVSGGDCGVNPHVIENNKQAAKRDPWFAVIGGDLAYDNGSNAKLYLDWLRNYSKHMVDTQGRLIPMVVCLGNHEVRGGYSNKRADAPFFFAHFDGLFEDTSYAALDFGDYLSLVLMDTGHVSKIGGDQTDWLDRTLRERTERPHLIVVGHVPCYPSARSALGPPGSGQLGTGEDQRKHWVPLFERHNVDLVLEHHDHTFKRTFPMKGGLKDKNGILYLGDGSWGQIRPVGKRESRPYIAAASATYHLTLHRLEDEERVHTAMEERGKIVDLCRTTKKVRRKG